MPDILCRRRLPCLRPTLRPIAYTVVLLTLSNVFMTFAWYAHLKEMSQKP